jgi:hypothetical protein
MIREQYIVYKHGIINFLTFSFLSFQTGKKIKKILFLKFLFVPDDQRNIFLNEI